MGQPRNRASQSTSFSSKNTFRDFLYIPQLVLRRVFMVQIVSTMPPNLYVEALASNVTVFGDKAFEEVVEVT